MRRQVELLDTVEVEDDALLTDDVVELVLCVD